jgi:hypothetical protein
MRPIIILLFLALNIVSGSAQCIDIDTKKFVDYLNKNVKPTLDLKLDREDGFLAINRQRQDLHIPDMYVWPVRRKWVYYFTNVRRSDSNFYYDTKKNLFVLDVKFEDEGMELKGHCPGCMPVYRDSRAPDASWLTPQILRISLEPVIYQRSVSFKVKDVVLLGKFYTTGFGDLIPDLNSKITAEANKQIKTIFNSTETQRLFNDALKPLLNSRNVASVRSVSLASSSLRTCR